jgi:outer membrane protein TolC
VGVPSELLRRRPDIRQAEAQIHAATAQIGVATADLFPRFSLTGSLSTQGDKFSALGDWANRFWSVGPSASWTLFATGRIRSNIEVQKALQEQSLIIYRQTVLTALQDVENALIASAKEQEHSRPSAAVAANAGLSIIDQAHQAKPARTSQAQGALYCRRPLWSEPCAVSTNLVALYKALGGGWTPPAPDSQPDG